MTTTKERHCPEPLSDFLDRGGDLRAELGGSLRSLTDELVYALAMLDDEDRARWARRQHSRVAEVLDDPLRHTEIYTKATHGQGWDSIQQYVNAQAWTGDMLADPALAERVIGLLSPAERADLEQRAELVRAPYQLAVRTALKARDDLGYFRLPRCQSCGSELAGVDLVVSVEGRMGPDGEPWAEVDPETVHCFSCITIVYEAIKAARSE